MKKWFTAEYRKFQIALAPMVPVAIAAVSDGNLSAEEIGTLVLMLLAAFGVKQVTNK